MPFVHGRVGTHLDFATFSGVLVGRYRNVFRNIDQNGAGTACFGNIESPAHGFGQILDVAHQEVVLYAWASNTHGVALLESVFTNGVRGHLAADDHHGNGVHVRGGNTSNRVGQAGAAGNQCNAYLVRRARISICRMHSRLLMTNKYVFEVVLLVDCVVNVQHGAARITENVVYALFGQAAHDDVGAIEFHMSVLS